MSLQKSKFYKQVSGDTERESDLEDDIEYQKKLMISNIKKRKPKGLLPLMLDLWFILFTFCLLASILFILFWFYNNDVVFYICGGLTLLMLILATYKFYTLTNRKHLLKHKKNLHRKYLKEQMKQKAQINRTCNAINILKDTKNRLTKTNAMNRNNAKLFEDIEAKIKTIGIDENTYNKASTLRNEWQTEYIKNEKKTLHKIYNRFIAEKSGNHNNILETLNREQFDEFQYDILPIIYRATLSNLNVFDELDPYDDGVINVKALEKYLDKIAENIDIINDNTFEHIEKVNTHTNISDASKPQHKSNKVSPSKPVKRKESLFADDYDIISDNVSHKEKHKSNKPSDIQTDIESVSKRKESLFAEDYDIISDIVSDKQKYKSNKPKDIQIDVEPVSKGKESLFAQDYDISEDKKEKRKIGKLKHKWGDTPSIQDKYDKHKSTKIINPDESWVRHKSAKAVHPVHDSIDALHVSKLVSQSVKMFPASPIYEEKEKEDDIENHKVKKVKILKSKSNPEESERNMHKIQRKGSLPDESWIKHKSPKLKHKPKPSVEQLQLKALVTEMSFKKKSALETVGENEEQTPMINKEEQDHDPFDTQ